MLLSIIVPIYNVEKYISNTLYSIINQTQNQFEIIIVDDGSTDNTVDIVKKILKKNNQISYKVIIKENGGVSSARNRGLVESSGDYVMFLDGDDYVSNNLIEKIQNYIDERKSDIICWGFNLVTEDRQDICNYYDIYNYDSKTMTGIDALGQILIYNSMWISTGSAAYCRKFLLRNNLKYTDGCSNGEDQEFTYKALFKSNRVVFINDILFYYIQRGGSISNSYNIKRFEAISAFKRTYEYMDTLDCDEIDEILNVLKNRHMISNYFFNLSSCLKFSGSHKRLYNKIKLLLYDIDVHYPGLNKEIKCIMKSYRDSNKLMQLKVKSFIISPILYFYLNNIEARIRRIKYKTKKMLKGY